MFALTESLVVNVSAITIDAVYDSFDEGTCDRTGLAGEAYQCPPGSDFVELSGQTPAGVHELASMPMQSIHSTSMTVSMVSCVSNMCMRVMPKSPT